jgi:hypothetical protein
LWIHAKGAEQTTKGDEWNNTKGDETVVKMKRVRAIAHKKMTHCETFAKVRSVARSPLGGQLDDPPKKVGVPHDNDGSLAFELYPRPELSETLPDAPLRVCT